MASRRLVVRRPGHAGLLSLLIFALIPDRLNARHPPAPQDARTRHVRRRPRDPHKAPPEAENAAVRLKF
jgi:hypothetical protein